MTSVRTHWRARLLRFGRLFFSLLTLATLIPLSGHLQTAEAVGGVTSLTLINADTDQPIAGFESLPANVTINLNALPTRNLNIRANTSGAVGSVRFALNSSPNYRTESTAPFAFEGDSNGNYSPWIPSAGTYAISATPYEAANAQGTAGPTFASTIVFTTVTATPVPTPTPSGGLTSMAVTSLTLINADTEQPIAGYETLPPSVTINLSTLPTRNLNVRANTTGTIGSVRFALNSNANYRIENGAPYALEGDNNGNYSAWVPSADTYAISATPYPNANAQGAPGPSVASTIVFVTGGSTPTPPPGATPTPTPNGNPAPVLSGELKKWHKVTITFRGPDSGETAGPNPFLDYRLNVTFTHPGTGKQYVVPGHYAADGNAAETSATSGNVWRVYFAPDETGTWNYSTSFRTGSQVAISTNPAAGQSAGYMDGATGSFSIQPTDKTGRDLRGKGRLKYVGERYLRFAETGQFFLKGGSDSPENFLAYNDFDNTTNDGNLLKSWSPHAGDYPADGTTWKGGKGSEIMGAINYLSSKGANSVSFLTMNINGDDKNVFPYVNKNGSASPGGGYVDDRTRFDVSKLDQWGLVFDYGTKKGMYLHFKLGETENDTLLDNGDLGVERKIYYREMVSRFGHNLALNWNISEEFNPGNEAQRLRDYSAYFAQIDPYHHNLVVHTYPGQQNAIYGPIVDERVLTGVSIQTDRTNVFNETKLWVDQSTYYANQGTGQKWIVANDEQGSASYGVPPDSGCSGAPSQANIRSQVIWGNLMAGGAGVELYYGYQCACADLTCQDYRSRNQMWDYVRYALDFFTAYLPFSQMNSDNNLTSATNDYVFAKPSEVYAIYLPAGGTTNVTIPTGTFEIKWYSPRNGGALQNGSVTSITGSGSRSIGNPPNNPSQDWAVLVRRMGAGANCADFTPPEGVSTSDVQSVAGRWGMRAGDPGWDDRFDLDHDGSITTADIHVVADQWYNCP